MNRQNFLKLTALAALQKAKELGQLFKFQQSPKDIQAEIKERRPKWRPTWRWFVPESYGGPNMPKSQPCLKCTRWVRRVDKTEGGAHYNCTRCGKLFFVGTGLA